MGRKKLDYISVKGDDGQSHFTRTFPGGGRAVLDDEDLEQGEAYDAKGRFLGFGSKKQIELAAETGRIIDSKTSKASELSAWVLWNDAVEAGEEVFETADGAQILGVDNDIHLLARRDEEFGWAVEWLGHGDLEDRYWDSKTECYQFVFADKPFKLE